MEFKTIKQINHIIIQGKLTYTPRCCTNCGVINHSHHDIIKNGTKLSTIKLTHINFQPLLLRLKKQRFLCKHCGQTFIAETRLVERHCFISNIIKQTIAMELREIQSMKLVAQHLSVSNSTVIRVLEKVAEPLASKHLYLPQHLSIDEFKSVRNVSGAMSFLFLDAQNHRLIDVVEDRRKDHLIDYFMRYPKDSRYSVKTVTMDMYSPYLEVVKACFPKAHIVIDRFHIVQHLNRALNTFRIRVMNEIRSKSATDYRKLKKQWKLLLKNEWELNFTDYQTHRLYDGLVTEKMMVDYLLSLNPRLRHVYMLVNDLRFALHNHDFELFRNTLEESRKYALPRKVRTTVQTLFKHREGIHNACLYTLSNGAIEGVNNKIKNIKRSGFGYRNYSHLRARILISY
ncbi:ISL3 family transposase, partial [Jeotgalibaca sp. A122]|uniref:ISL3 family transposase n=1 Tax=Jeotgalibaca sp. A122 TaxID=3457322 RepID=UPI003FCF73FF